MTKKTSESLSNLESGLLQAMRALDNQVARALERSPAEQEALGVQKWKPYAERVESLCSFVIDCLGDERISLDSLLILTQVFPKALAIISDELGKEGLGAVRSAYVESVLENLEREMGRAIRQLKSGEPNLM